jgi:hypothetical protein
MLSASAKAQNYLFALTNCFSNFFASRMVVDDPSGARFQGRAPLFFL